jgi:uncharacterized protein (UPF0264 family)
MTQTVKAVVYAAFASRKHRSHQRIADIARRVVKGSQTSARSVASMYVDYKRGGGEAPSGAPKGQVKELVYALFAQGGLTAQQIADKVREAVPTSQTTHKSVASMKVDWKRSGGAVAPMAEAVAADFGL